MTFNIIKKKEIGNLFEAKNEHKNNIVKPALKYYLYVENRTRLFFPNNRKMYQ